MVPMGVSDGAMVPEESVGLVGWNGGVDVALDVAVGKGLGVAVKVGVRVTVAVDVVVEDAVGVAVIDGDGDAVAVGEASMSSGLPSRAAYTTYPRAASSGMRRRKSRSFLIGGSTERRHPIKAL